MAQFTRKFLKTITIGDKGLSDDQIDAIIDLHAEVVNGLMEELKTAKAAAEKLPAVQKELDDAKANNGDDYKAKYEKEHNDFEAYKKSITDKETAQAKANAVKAYFESKGITGTNLDIAMRGATEEIGGVELADGKIKDTKALDTLLSGTYKGLIVSKGNVGANTGNPPAGAGGATKTKEEILKIKDTAERQKAIAENHELFGI